MVANQEQLDVALHQLASFKGMLNAMRLHLEATEPTLIPLVSESYQYRIQKFKPKFAITCCKHSAEIPPLPNTLPEIWRKSLLFESAHRALPYGEAHLTEVRQRIAHAPAAADAPVPEDEPFDGDHLRRLAGWRLPPERPDGFPALHEPSYNAVVFGDDLFRREL